MTNNTDHILEKYSEIIQEELNVKDIVPLDKNFTIKKIYKPLWNKLSAKFGKDTGKVIQLGKQWNTKELPNGKLVIFDESNNERLLEKDDYDVDYEWLSGTDMAVDTGIVVKYDLHITPELAQEWLARELSRFLNQMRKDADFSVEKRAACLYNSDSKVLKDTIDNWKDFLIQEALLTDIVESKKLSWDHEDTFSLEEGSITFSLTTD